MFAPFVPLLRLSRFAALACLACCWSLPADGEPFTVSEIFPRDGSEDVSLSVAPNVRLSQPAQVETLSGFELFRLEGNEQVEKVELRPATDLTNASITLVPSRFLEANTEYQLTADERIRATDGSRLKPFRSRFTTGSGGATDEAGLSFSPSVFDRSRSMTTVAFGPDRRLYAADAFGSLVRWDIDEQGNASNKTQLLHDDSQSRQYIDLEWDPAATADNLVLWVSYGERLDYTAERKYFTGTIAKLYLDEGPREQVVVTGLPHGREIQGGFDTLPHQPNGLAFRGGLLYQSVGSTSSSGGTANWGLPEQPLSACILEIDYQAIDEPLDVHPSEYSLHSADARVRIYASGVRNALQLLPHSNGKLYTAVNLNDRRGPADGVPDHPGTEGDQNQLVTQTTPDYESLLIIEKGRHYGHPNPARGQYVLMGGNPTSEADPFEIPDYPVGTPPDDGFAPELMYEIWQYGGTSANGLIEYLPEFDHPLRRALLSCFYSSGDIAVMPLWPDGFPIAVRKLRGPEGKLSFNGPLDITMDPATGVLYLADFGTQNKFGSDGSMILLRPQRTGN